MTHGDEMRIERLLNDFRVDMAGRLSSVMERLDGMRDHDRRIRRLEQNTVSREEVTAAIIAAIEASRRPAWKDIGSMIAVATGGVSATILFLR